MNRNNTDPTAQKIEITPRDIIKHSIIKNIVDVKESVLPQKKNSGDFVDMLKSILYTLILALFIGLFIALAVFWVLYIKEKNIDLFKENGVLKTLFFELPKKFFESFAFDQFLLVSLFFFLFTTLMTYGLEAIYRKRIFVFKVLGYLLQTVVFVLLGYILSFFVLSVFRSDLEGVLGDKSDLIVYITSAALSVILSTVLFLFVIKNTFNRFKNINAGPDDPSILLNTKSGDTKEVKMQDTITNPTQNPTQNTAKNPTNRIRIAFPVVLAIWVTCISLTFGGLLFIEHTTDTLVPVLKAIRNELLLNNIMDDPKKIFLIFGSLVAALWTYVSGLKVFSFFMGSVVGELGTKKSIFECITASISKTVQQLASIVSGTLISGLVVVGIICLLIFYDIPKMVIGTIRKDATGNYTGQIYYRLVYLGLIFASFFLVMNDIYKYFTFGMFPGKDLQNADRSAYFAAQPNMSKIGLIVFVIILIIITLIGIAVYFTYKKDSSSLVDDIKESKFSKFINEKENSKKIIILLRIIYTIFILIFFIIPAIVMSFSARKNYANYMASREYSAIDEKSFLEPKAEETIKPIIEKTEKLDNEKNGLYRPYIKKNKITQAI